MSDEWVETTLGDVCSFISEKVDPATLPGETQYVGLEHITPRQPLLSSHGYASDVSSLVAAYTAGDTLFGRLRPYLHKVAIASEPGVCSPEILVLRANTELVDPGFLYLLASSDDAISHAVALSAGSRMPRTSVNDLASFEIRLPPLHVQRRIVDLLAHLDNHLANLQTERDAAEVLLAVSRRSLVASADLVPLATLATEGGVQIGPFGSQLHASDYTESGIPVVMPKNLIAGRIHEEGIKRISTDTAERLSRHLLKAGDIVFPRRGDLAKRALVTDSQEGWLCGTGCIRFRPNEDVDGTTIFQAISGKEATDWLTEHAVGTTMLNLNTEIVSKLPVADPRTGSGELAEACRAQALLLEALKEESDRLEQVRRHLISSLLSGEVEVPLTYDSLLSEVA